MKSRGGEKNELVQVLRKHKKLLWTLRVGWMNFLNQFILIAYCEWQFCCLKTANHETTILFYCSDDDPAKRKSTTGSN